MDKKFLEVSQIKLRGEKEIDGMKFHDIEGGFEENKKAMLAKDIAEIHGRELKAINQNINNNISRFKNGIDIVDLKNGHFELPFESLGLSNRDISISKNIYLLSERGYSKLLKILEDDVAWEQYEKLVDGYFNMRAEIKEQELNTSKLSPELQMFKQIFDTVAKQQLENKEIKAEIKETKDEIQGIRDVIALDPNQWRKDTAALINKIANGLGGFEHIKVVREEAYKLLDNSYGVSLKTRLLNKQKKMALEGTPKYKIDKVNYLDVIAEDRKLINGYINIIGKLAIKYGVGGI